MESLNRTYSFGNYSFFKKLIIGISGDYFSETYLDLDNNFTMPQNYSINASMKFLFGKNNNSILFRVNNFTSNSPGLVSGYVYDGVPLYYVQAPRNYYVTLNLNL